MLWSSSPITWQPWARQTRRSRTRRSGRRQRTSPCLLDPRLSDKAIFTALPTEQPSAGSEFVPAVALMDMAEEEVAKSPEQPEMEEEAGVDDVSMLAALIEPDARRAPVGYVVSKTQGGRCLRLHHVGCCF